MKITRMGEDEFRVSLARDEARILINAMNETLRAFRPAEFQTRVGATVEEVKAIISGIEAAWR